MNPCDPIVQQARQDLLDQAYILDGRANPDQPHPMRGLYTALTLTTAYDCLSQANPND
jgi:hypothetical protein